MSAISNFLTFLRSAIYAIDVRDGIADAIEQCYNDVNNPTLKTEALEAALQNKIDQGEMAALTIGDHTITAAKLANGVIPAADATLTETGKPADAAETGRQIGLIKADLDAIVPGLSNSAKEALLACFAHAGWTDENGQDYYDALATALETNTYWDFEWYAESEEFPAGMEYTSAEFVTRNGEKLLKVANPTLTFNHYGDCELEIECKWEHFDPSIRYWNTVPQLMIVAANHGVNGNDGFKAYCLSAQNDNFVYTNVSGSAQSTQIDGTEKISVYNLKFENGSGLLKVDGSVVASGAGVTKNAYIYDTGIYDNTTNQNYGLVIKSIKFRKMRVAPEDIRQLPDDYTWLYDATEGDLLSEENYVNVSSSGTYTETIINEQLVLNSQPTEQGSNNFVRFSLSDNTSTNARLSARVKFNDIPRTGVNAPGAEGFRMQVSNGTSGAQVFFISQPSNNDNLGVSYFEGSNRQYVDLSDYNMSEYHIVEIELANGVQTMYIDGDIIFTSNTLSSNYCTANAILNQMSSLGSGHGAVTTIDWIAYNEVS